MVLTVAQSPALAAALKDTAAAIEEALDRLLPRGADAQEQLYEAMRYSTLGGGKRLRGFLVVQGAALFNVSPRAALRVAAAVEMLHAYSLIHDDLPAMDDDDMRRGKPSCHRAFDEATAILAGDALQARAFEVLAEPDTHSDPAVRVELVRALAEAAGAHGMAGGQMIDLLAEHEHLSEAEITRLQMLKTGRLLTFSAEAGAIMGKAALVQRHALAAYGRDLGLAFQIADDLLDATAEAAAVGKATGKDATAGKATLVALLGVERARAQAALLAQQAAAHLDSFETPGDLLKDLVHHVVSRRA